jgi:Flp pilus assembly protein TadG
MVEMALILPILLLVILGLIEFGRAFFYYTMVSNAAREGARYGIVHPKDLDGIRDAAESRLLLIPTDTVTIDISYQFCEGGCAPDGSNIEEGNTQVVVDVSTDFSMMTPLFRPVFPPTTIQLISARTIVAGARAHKTPAPP